ncbi:hypothetical protein GCM10025794_30400 [Massilia kyonggiensis]
MYNTGNNSRSGQTIDEHIAGIDIKKKEKETKTLHGQIEATWTQSEAYID